MSSFLKKISSTEVNKETKNGGASGWCALYAAQLPIAAALCATGNKCGCSDYQNMSSYLSRYCR
jgi:hypothetical protein